MSRTLSKILVICALVVILPLTIVGTAFAAYYSVDAVVNITIQTLGVADPNSTDALAAVRYDGKDITDHQFQISQSHMDSVTLEAKNVGYDFIGWFKGDSYTPEMNDQENLAEGNKLSVKMEDGGSYVAVFKVITYHISWHYIVDPDENMANGTYTSEDPDKANHVDGEYVYGAELKALSQEKAHGYKISNEGGWCLYDGEQPVLNKHYKRAEFKDAYGKDLGVEGREVQLTYNWIGKDLFTINYYNIEDRSNPSKTAIANDSVVKDETHEYNYASKFAELVAAGEVTEAQTGYKWTKFNKLVGTGLNDVTSATDDFTNSEFVDSIDIYVTATPVSYTANLTVENEDAEYTGAAITFTVEDVENAQTKLAAFFAEENYEKDYFFYEFNGIKVGSGELITSGDNEKLKTALNTLIDAHKHEEATVDFVAEFRTVFSVTVTAPAKYACTDEDYLMNDDPVYNAYGTVFPNDNIIDNVGEQYLQGANTDQTLEYLMNMKGCGTLYADKAHTQEVQYYGINVGSTYVITNKILTLQESTVADLLQTLHDTGYTATYSYDAAAHQFTITSIDVIFEKIR